jgi:hypothetical protein
MTRFSLLAAAATIALISSPAFADGNGIGGAVGGAVGGVAGAVGGVVGSVSGSTVGTTGTSTGSTSSSVAASVSGSSDGGITANAKVGDTNAKVKLFGNQHLGRATADTGIANTRGSATVLGSDGTKANVTTGIANTRGNATILGSDGGSKVSVTSGILGGTRGSVSVLGDGTTAAVSVSIGGDGDGTGGTGGGSGGDNGGGPGVGNGIDAGTIGAISASDRQELQVKCRNVLLNPANYGKQVLSLCRLIASL